MSKGRLGQDAPLRSVQAVTGRYSNAIRKPGVILKLFCGHERALGGDAYFSAENWRCLSCVPLQNDMGRDRSW